MYSGVVWNNLNAGETVNLLMLQIVVVVSKTYLPYFCTCFILKITVGIVDGIAKH